MDPMNFSIDDGEHTHPSSSAPRCQYQQSQPPSVQGSFSSPSRDAHHYDPIHNTDSWYQLDNSAGQGRSRAPPALSQWGGSYVHTNTWQGFGDGQARLGGELTDHLPQTAFMGIPNIPWNEMQGYDAGPFGYSPFMNVQNRATAPVTSSTGRHAAPPAIPSPIPTPLPMSNLSATHPSYPRMDHRSDPPNPSNPSSDGPSLLERSRAARIARAEQRGALASQLSQSYDHPRSNPTEDHSLARRRTAQTWDSDEDEGGLADSEDFGHRRHSQLFGEQDDERALAAMRGAIAAGKKIPSKEALASLERVDMKDLKDSDKVCTICYNDIGVENPDGVLENPIRLPKCKHVFGEKCIKKWFQDSDTCPYCRDKLPSELSIRKTAAIESLRAHRFAAITAQAQRARQHGFPQRYPSTEELAGPERNSFVRHTQEEYHYIMTTGNQASESWSYSSHNRVSQRESPETRRRQGRGRAGLSRPISVGSARYVAPTMNHHSASQRAHLGLVSPTAPSPTPHRSTSPGQMQQGSGGSSPPRSIGIPFPGRPLSIAVSTEEASPLVVIGSGVSASEGSSSLGATRHSHGPYYDQSTDQWSEVFPQHLTHNGRTNLPPIANYRLPPMDTRSLPPLFHEHQRIQDGSAGNSQTSMGSPNYPSGQSDSSQDSSNRGVQHRWSGQFLN